MFSMFNPYPDVHAAGFTPEFIKSSFVCKSSTTSLVYCSMGFCLAFVIIILLRYIKLQNVV